MIADRDTPVPEGIGTFRNFGTLNGSSPSISGENVAFVATWPREGNTTLGSGVYAHINGELKVIADTNTQVPGETTNFGVFGVSLGLSPSISGENVVFGAGWKEDGNPGVFGIYAWINGSLRVIADTRTKVPQRDGNFFNFNFSDIVSRGSVPAIDNENVAFIASGGLPREYGIYAYFNGSLQVIAETNITTVPGTTATFLNVAGGDGGRMSPSLSGENIAFGGTWREEGGPAVLSGIFAYINGELRTIADRSTKVPGKNATFTNFKADEGTSPTISGENVLFGALAFGEETGGFNGLYAHLDPPVIPAVSGRRIILLVLLIIVAGALILRRSTSELR